MVRKRSGAMQRVKKTARAHQIYKNKDGKRVPGCTTITGVLNKPALVPWANRIGLEGTNVRDYVDSLASAGTCAHLMVEKFLSGEKLELGGFTGDQIELATISFEKFKVWFEEKDPTIIKSELDLISEKYQFGGRCDIYVGLNGKRVLLDIKTSKGVFPEHFTQVSGGYRILLTENGFPVDDVKILRLGRNEEEGFEEVGLTPTQIELHTERFLLCREIYENSKKLKLNAWR